MYHSINSTTNARLPAQLRVQSSEFDSTCYGYPYGPWDAVPCLGVSKEAYTDGSLLRSMFPKPFIGRSDCLELAFIPESLHDWLQLVSHKVSERGNSGWGLQLHAWTQLARLKKAYIELTNVVLGLVKGHGAVHLESEELKRLSALETDDGAHMVVKKEGGCGSVLQALDLADQEVWEILRMDGWIMMMVLVHKFYGATHVSSSIINAVAGISMVSEFSSRFRIHEPKQWSLDCARSCMGLVLPADIDQELYFVLSGCGIKLWELVKESQCGSLAQPTPMSSLYSMFPSTPPIPDDSSFLEWVPQVPEDLMDFGQRSPLDFDSTDETPEGWALSYNTARRFRFSQKDLDKLKAPPPKPPVNGFKSKAFKNEVVRREALLQIMAEVHDGKLQIFDEPHCRSLMEVIRNQFNIQGWGFDDMLIEDDDMDLHLDQAAMLESDHEDDGRVEVPSTPPIGGRYRRSLSPCGKRQPQSRTHHRIQKQQRRSRSPPPARTERYGSRHPSLWQQERRRSRSNPRSHDNGLPKRSEMAGQPGVDTSCYLDDERRSEEHTVATGVSVDPRSQGLTIDTPVVIREGERPEKSEYAIQMETCFASRKQTLDAMTKSERKASGLTLNHPLSGKPFKRFPPPVFDELEKMSNSANWWALIRWMKAIAPSFETQDRSLTISKWIHICTPPDPNARQYIKDLERIYRNALLYRSVDDAAFAGCL